MTKIKLFIGSVAIFIVGSISAYRLWGHKLIRAMYEGRSIDILNQLMASQNTYPLSFFLDVADRIFYSLLVAGPLFLCLILIVLRGKRNYSDSFVAERAAQHVASLETYSNKYIGAWILIAAALSLFAELAIIRLHGAFFQLFAYFKNISLLSCFLGLGIGYARGGNKKLLTPFVMPLMALQIVALYVLRLSPVERLFQNPISEQLGFGIQQASTTGHVIIVYVFLVIVFTFNALTFIPLGQLVSHFMLRTEKLVAYSWNLLGSLLGIILFSFVSFIWAPPGVWIGIVAAGTCLFLYKELRTLVPTVIATSVLLILFALPFHLNQYDVYSPYQLLTLVYKKDGPVIKSANTYYQTVLNLRKDVIENNERLVAWEASYSFPYTIKEKKDAVLVVGSGTGNDVAAALRNEVGHVDAVEIDPAIVRFGKELHPEFPYQAENVTVHINDARAYLEATHKTYDLIVYGLLDSHTLLSGRSGGIRLDSYVYTVEGFRAARRALNEDGLISLTFIAMNPKISKKLFGMLTEAFDGREPVVYKTTNDESLTFLASESDKVLDGITHSAFHDVTDDVRSVIADVDLSTDNWPFFYMPVRKYPLTYVMMLALLFCLSLLFIQTHLPKSERAFSFPCFFLGAGFMLLETKGITELSLLYGSTWVVISVVIAAILSMAFLANTIILKLHRPLHPVLVYGCLFCALIAGYVCTFISLHVVSPVVAKVVATTILTLPLFFAGFAFSNELKRAPSVAVALSSNLLGAMLGGFFEYNAMCFGFRALYILALCMYFFAFLAALRYQKT